LSSDAEEDYNMKNKLTNCRWTPIDGKRQVR